LIIFQFKISIAVWLINFFISNKNPMRKDKNNTIKIFLTDIFIENFNYFYCSCVSCKIIDFTNKIYINYLEIKTIVKYNVFWSKLYYFKNFKINDDLLTWNQFSFLWKQIHFKNT
jgi:hypothetical protein